MSSSIIIKTFIPSYLILLINIVNKQGKKETSEKRTKSVVAKIKLILFYQLDNNSSKVLWNY